MRVMDKWRFVQGGLLYTRVMAPVEIDTEHLVSLCKHYRSYAPCWVDLFRESVVYTEVGSLQV